MLSEVEIKEDDIIGSLDTVRMFSNMPIKKTLDVVKEELNNDETLGSTDCEVEDISKLLELSIETYFKTLDGKVYFRKDGFPNGKLISEPMVGIYALV